MLIFESYGIKRIPFEEWLPNTKSSVIEQLASRGINGDTETIYNLFKNKLEEAKEKGVFPKIYKNVQKVLKSLNKKGIKMAVISKHPKENLLNEAMDYNIHHFFDIISGSVPDKTNEIIGLLKKWGINNTEVYYIGDTTYDIEASQKADVFSIAITTGYQTEEKLKEKNPGLILNSLTELLNHV